MKWRRTALAFATGLLAAAGAAAGENDFDLEKATIELSRMLEPDLDAAAMKRALSELEAKAKAVLEGVAEPVEIVRRLNLVLLEGRRVSYVSSRQWPDSTLSCSLLRKRGNCLSTSTLYVVMGRRLGLPLRSVLIPRHVLVRYDDGRTRLNIETTAAGKDLPDELYRAQSLWYEADTRQLGYGRSLTSEEFAAILYGRAAGHLLSVGRLKEAIESVDRSLELWPENGMAQWTRLTIRYFGLGEYAEALAGIQKLAAETASPEVRAYCQLTMARHCQALSRHEHALRLLGQAFQGAPKHLQSQALSLMGLSYRALKRPGEALAVVELARILEGDAAGLTGLAGFYRREGRLDDAIRCLRISAGGNPEDWRTHLLLAACLVRAGQEEEGWKILRQVAEPAENKASYYVSVASVYAAAGRKPELLEYLEKGLSFSGTPGVLSEVESEVEFERYRDDAGFKRVVRRHRKRLLGED